MWPANLPASELARWSGSILTPRQNRRGGGVNNGDVTALGLSWSREEIYGTHGLSRVAQSSRHQ